MSTTTVAAPDWVTAPPKAFYVRQVLKTIRECREAKYDFASDELRHRAHGMIMAGLFLDATTEDEYHRLWDLASNASHYRWQEQRQFLQPYTWKPTPAAQEASA